MPLKPGVIFRREKHNAQPRFAATMLPLGGAALHVDLLPGKAETPEIFLLRFNDL